jgi:hypothetical protein
MIDYAWQAYWPFKGTPAMTMDLGTDHAFDFSVAYDLEEEGVRPTLETLWAMMGKAIIKDGIILPDFVSRNREHYAAQCEKVNQFRCSGGKSYQVECFRKSSRTKDHQHIQSTAHRRRSDFGTSKG